MSRELLDFILKERWKKASTHLDVAEIHEATHELVILMFPEHHPHQNIKPEDLKICFKRIEKVFHDSFRMLKVDQKKFELFLKKIPQIAKTLDLDAKAALQGDPAAQSLEEVIITYPGFYALCVHRLAHAFFKLQIPLLPRLMSEYAHQKTGIDIHPGASIGESCFIDHGTGVVIGETSKIGRDVKIYQGVTLGALSVKKKMQKQKRHPTIQDGTVLYANSTILGGETIVGAGSIIGGNVWLTHSVPKNSVILHDDQLKKSKTKK